MIDHTTIGQLVLLVTTLSGFLIQIYRENRNRRWDHDESARQRAWDLEDRRAAREDVALKLELTRAEAVRAAKETKDEIVMKIDENTKVNTQQIEVGNQFNAKMKELQQSFMDVRSEAIVEASKMAAQVAAERDTRLTEAVANAEDTLERVDDNTKKTVDLLTTNKT